MKEEDSIKKLSEKFPGKFKVAEEEGDELDGIALDDEGFIDEGVRTIDIEVQDLRALLLYGKIQLADAGVELVLRKTAGDDEIMKIKRVLKNNKSSGKVIVPVKWVNSRVALILLEILD